MSNSKPFVFQLSEHFDEYKYGVDRQELKYKNTPFSGSVYFCDLSECPEDAIIGRDLFAASDYIEAVRFGLSIARQGYTSIEVENVPWEEE